MEEYIPALKGMLNNAVKVSVDVENLTITLTVTSKIKLNDDFADPNEVKVMLHIFGGLELDFPVDIEVNSEAQTIAMKFKNDVDLKKVQDIMDNIWDRTTQLLQQVMEGDLSGLKEIADIDD